MARYSQRLAYLGIFHNKRQICFFPLAVLVFGAGVRYISWIKGRCHHPNLASLFSAAASVGKGDVQPNYQRLLLWKSASDTVNLNSSWQNMRPSTCRKTTLDAHRGEEPGLASIWFQENMQLIIFLPVSSWVSLKSVLVIITVIIILIQISNLSKYYALNATSPSQLWWELLWGAPTTQVSGPLSSKSHSAFELMAWSGMLGLSGSTHAMGKQCHHSRSYSEECSKEMASLKHPGRHRIVIDRLPGHST